MGIKIMKIRNSAAHYKGVLLFTAIAIVVLFVSIGEYIAAVFFVAGFLTGGLTAILGGVEKFGVWPDGSLVDRGNEGN